MTGTSVNSLRKLAIACANLMGFLLGCAGLWYIFTHLREMDLSTLLSGLTTTQMALMAALCAGFAAANALVAVGWRLILEDFGGHLSNWEAQIIFSRTNLLKYIPGNIFHLAGRQVLAMQAGVSGLASAKSISLETALLLVSSGAISSLLLLNRVQLGDILIGAIILAGITVVTLSVNKAGFRGTALTALIFLMYHVCGGMIFLALLAILNGPSMPMAYCVHVVLAYVASWSLGLLTPGAPAGLGVREAALIGLLQDTVVDKGVLATAVLLVRCMNIVADIAYYLVVHGLNRAFAKQRESKQ